MNIFLISLFLDCAVEVFTLNSDCEKIILLSGTRDDFLLWRNTLSVDFTLLHRVCGVQIESGKASIQIS